MPSTSRVGAPVPVPVAKVARPRMMDLQPRRRLFSRLDALRRDHPMPWIAAPAGSGKAGARISYRARGIVLGTKQGMPMHIRLHHQEVARPQPIRGNMNRLVDLPG